jgi:hypothetical protein
MTRECHVRICERSEGKFLWPTRLAWFMSRSISAFQEIRYVNNAIKIYSLDTSLAALLKPRGAAPGGPGGPGGLPGS